MKKRFRIGKLLFLSATSDGDVVSIYRPTSKCRPTATLSVTAQSASSLCGAARARAALLLQRFSVLNLFCRACARGIRWPRARSRTLISLRGS
jgi:hypothetical protein